MLEKDLALICNRPTLKLGESGAKPHGPYSLKPKKKEVMRWLKQYKFMDGYAVGFRRAKNVKTRKSTRLKSHDYHIIIETCSCYVSWVCEK
jgi:hypothetical protein